MAADEAGGRLARAKVNLTLHLRGQRGDGLHLLDSLVVFPALGDRLSFRDADGFSLTLSGPFGRDLSVGEDNLVLRAARELAGHAGMRQGAALHLEKNLPLASGIGGGSSDAATALHFLARHWGCEIPDALALGLGADVPVCLRAPIAQRMQGIGEDLTPVPGLPQCWMVLVNPLVEVPTGAVFGRVRDKCPPSAPGLPAGGFDRFEDLTQWLGTQRNDLQAPAIEICPVIGEVLAALDGAPVARMSGSGATCFALLPDQASATGLAAEIGSKTGWWASAAPVGGAPPTV